MNLGFIGLGKMGSAMVSRLLGKSYNVVAFDPDLDIRERVQSEGAEIVDSALKVVQSLEFPRLVWIMVPHKAVDSVIDEITVALENGDTIIDGGNSNYKESVKRAKSLREKGINFLDVGVSGGPKGGRDGASVMVGGEKESYRKHEQLFKDLAATDGYGYMGASGAGHFVKMVHNGIEYGMMQAIAEGFAVMKKSNFYLDLEEVARVFNHASVVESRLVGWLKQGYEKYGEDLKDVSGIVKHTGEGEWTVQAAEELGIPVSIIKGALDFRKESEKKPSYTGKILSTLRNQFGGHDVKN